jgi:hypothetical protein
LRSEGFFSNLNVLYGGLGIGKLWFLIPNFFFFSSCNFFQFLVIKALVPDWIRIGIQPKMLDPDPDEMNADPQPYLEDHLLPGLQRREPVPHGVQPQAELLTGEAHRMTVDVSASAAAWVQSSCCGSGTFSGHVGSG